MSLFKIAIKLSILFLLATIFILGLVSLLRIGIVSVWIGVTMMGLYWMARHFRKRLNERFHF
jgi:hypothetical protein